jgi:hypothetical protein
MPAQSPGGTHDGSGGARSPAPLRYLPAMSSRDSVDVQHLGQAASTVSTKKAPPARPPVNIRFTDFISDGDHSRFRGDRQRSVNSGELRDVRARAMRPESGPRGVVPVGGVEPPRSSGQPILSRPRLPFRHTSPG